MDRAKAFVATSVLLTAAVAVSLLFAWSVPEPTGREVALWAAEGHPGMPTDEPLRVSALDGDGVTRAFGFGADGTPYIILKIPPSLLADALQDGFAVPPSTPHPSQDMMLIAYDATGTLHGCAVEYLPALPPPGLWLIDQCHQGQFNALDGGAPRPGTPTDGPLMPYKVVLHGDGDPSVSVQAVV